jgi:hypothetical protein
MRAALTGLALIGCATGLSVSDPGTWIDDGAAYATGLRGHCELSVSIEPTGRDLAATAEVDGLNALGADGYAEFVIGPNAYPLQTRVDVRLDRVFVGDEVVAVRVTQTGPGDPSVPATGVEVLCSDARTSESPPR